MQVLWCRTILSREQLVSVSGTYGLRRIMMANSRRALRKEKRDHAVAVISVLAIVAAVLCFI